MTREPWGNYVQTDSMVGLIAAAIRLSMPWDDAFQAWRDRKRAMARDSGLGIDARRERRKLLLLRCCRQVVVLLRVADDLDQQAQPHRRQRPLP